MNDNIPLDAGTMADQLTTEAPAVIDPAVLPAISLTEDMKELESAVEKLGEDILHKVENAI